MEKNYQSTMRACFAGYIVQAIVNNFVPLLFVTFQASYNISLSKITLLITVNFGVQLLIDLASTLFVDKIGYKASTVMAHLFCVSGFAPLLLLLGACGGSIAVHRFFSNVRYRQLETVNAYMDAHSSYQRSCIHPCTNSSIDFRW